MWAALCQCRVLAIHSRAPLCHAPCAPGSSRCHPKLPTILTSCSAFPKTSCQARGSSWMKVGRDEAAFPAGARRSWERGCISCGGVLSSGLRQETGRSRGSTGLLQRFGGVCYAARAWDVCAEWGISSKDPSIPGFVPWQRVGCADGSPAD